jgi:hypothetical protein
MKPHVAIKCTMLTITLGLGFTVLHYIYGQKGEEKQFIKPPAVKLMPDKASMERLHQLALKAQILVDNLLVGNGDIKSMIMNHAMTAFFPYGLSHAMDAQQMVELVQEALEEVGSKPITVELGDIDWFGGPKQHTIVVKVKENDQGMPHALNALLETSTKKAGMLPKSYKPKFAYNPHTSLVGVTGAGETHLELEGANLEAWQKISTKKAQEKADIIRKLQALVAKTPITFDKVVVYGSDFQPVATIPLQ